MKNKEPCCAIILRNSKPSEKFCFDEGMKVVYDLLLVHLFLPVLPTDRTMIVTLRIRRYHDYPGFTAVIHTMRRTL